MRWLRKAAVAGGIAGLLVLAVPLPTFAVTPPPPPVTPVGTLPSAFAASGTDSKFTTWAVNAAAGRTIGGYGLGTPAATFIRGAGAGAMNPLTAAFSAGFAVGNSGLHMYAAATDSDVLPGICESAAPIRNAAGLLYPDLMPDCLAPVVSPNSDVAGGIGGMSLGAWSIAFTKTVDFSTFRVACYTVTTMPPPTGYRLEGHTGAGSWTTTGLTTGGTAGGSCGTGARYTYLTFDGGTPTYNSSSFRTAALRLVRVSDGVVVAEMQTIPANPFRQLSCTVQWNDGTFSTSLGYTYTQAAGLPISSTAMGCRSAYAAGGGRTPKSISVNSDDAQILSTPFLQSDGKLELWKDDASCLKWAADCSGWWDATSAGTVPGPYSCTYNLEAVPLTECSVYRHTFDDRQVECPAITDPADGETVPWVCGKDPNSTSPGDVPSPGEKCFDSYSETPNPLEWGVRAIQCGFVSLLIPRPEVVEAAFQESSGKWSQTMPGQIGDVVGTVFVPPDVQSGCAGPTITLPLSVINENVPDFVGNPLSACEAPMSDWAAMSRLISGAVLMFVTGLGIVRRASSVVNAEGLG